MGKLKKKNQGGGKSSKKKHQQQQQQQQHESRRKFRNKKKNHMNTNDSDFYPTEEDEDFRQKLETDGLSIAEMSADGNCLFRSLSDQLYGDYGNSHEQVRAEICDYMEQNKDEFKFFLVLDDDSCEEGDDGKDFESYMDTMRGDAEWGGNLELVAAARLYRRKVTVFSPILSAYTVEPGEKPTGPDLMVSFHDNDHYNSVRNEKFPPRNMSTRKNNGRGSLDITKEDNHSSTSSTSTTETTLSHSSETLSSNATSMSTDVDAHHNALMSRAQKPMKKNDPCACGSGQRYKKCCLAKAKHAARINKKREELDDNLKSDTIDV